MSDRWARIVIAIICWMGGMGCCFVISVLYAVAAGTL